MKLYEKPDAQFVSFTTNSIMSEYDPLDDGGNAGVGPSNIQSGSGKLP